MFIMCIFIWQCFNAFTHYLIHAQSWWFITVGHRQTPRYWAWWHSPRYRWPHVCTSAWARTAWWDRGIRSRWPVLLPWTPASCFWRWPFHWIFSLSLTSLLFIYWHLHSDVSEGDLIDQPACITYNSCLTQLASFLQLPMKKCNYSDRQTGTVCDGVPPFQVKLRTRGTAAIVEWVSLHSWFNPL